MSYLSPASGSSIFLILSICTERWPVAACCLLVAMTTVGIVPRVQLAILALHCQPLQSIHQRHAIYINLYNTGLVKCNMQYTSNRRTICSVETCFTTKILIHLVIAYNLTLWNSKIVITVIITLRHIHYNKN